MAEGGDKPKSTAAQVGAPSFLERLFGGEAEVTDSSRPWRILVVDDDPDVHKVTRMALRDFEFEGRGADVQSAHSGNEARTVFRRHADVAVALVDVVMESEQAGLEFVDWVRTGCDRPVRLLIRTGEAGSAPPSQIAAKHDINGYLDKTLLTADRLKAQLIIELRAYMTAMRAEDN